MELGRMNQVFSMNIDAMKRKRINKIYIYERIERRKAAIH